MQVFDVTFKYFDTLPELQETKLLNNIIDKTLELRIYSQDEESVKNSFQDFLARGRGVLEIRKVN